MELAVVAVCLWLARFTLRNEAADFAKVEDARKEIVSGKGRADVDDLRRMSETVERVRRVTWRMGVLGALILSAMLVLTGVIPVRDIPKAGLPAWIVLTSVLNFRAYHVEDEGTAVLKAFFQK